MRTILPWVLSVIAVGISAHPQDDCGAKTWRQVNAGAWVQATDQQWGEIQQSLNDPHWIRVVNMPMKALIAELNQRYDVNIAVRGAAAELKVFLFLDTKSTSADEAIALLMQAFKLSKVEHKRTGKIELSL